MHAGLRFHTDLQLLEALKEGKQAALNVLFDKYAPAMQQVINRLTSNEELTEEVLHNTFILIWKAPGKYDASKQNLFVWMLGIARKLAEDAVRQKNADRVSEIQSFGNSVYNPEAIHSRMNGKNATEQEVGGQEALKLVFVKGYSLQVAAKKMNLSIEQLQLKLRIELNSFRGTNAK